MGNEDINVKKYRILVVDNDDKARQNIAAPLIERGFQVMVSSSSNDAKAIMKVERLDMVITELRMPHESGIDLVRWARRVYDTSFRQNMPIHCMIATGFVHLLEKEDMADLHLAGYIKKPFESHEVVQAVMIALGLIKPESDKEEDNTELEEQNYKVFKRNYCQVLLSDLNNQPNLNMDLFVQLSLDKYVRIAKKGDEINGEQLRRYREKGIQHLFVKKEDYQAILDFNIKLSKAVAGADKLGLEKRQKFLARTGEMIMENTFVNGVNQETFEDARDYICNSISTLLEDDETFSLLEVLNGHSNHLYAHSLGVSIYSVMIAQKMGWSSGGNLFKLSFGALMHDIGKSEFDPELLQKPKSDLTFAEKSLLESHPERGKKILEGLKAIPNEVVSIAYEHHENVLGQGYPRFLKKNRISPMARIVNVADEFCYFAIKNPDYPEADARKALQMMDQYKHNLLDHDALMALRLIVKEQSKHNKAS